MRSLLLLAFVSSRLLLMNVQLTRYDEYLLGELYAIMLALLLLAQCVQFPQREV